MNNNLYSRRHMLKTTATLAGLATLSSGGNTFANNIN